MDNERIVQTETTTESGLNSKYMDSVHRDGTIWNIAVMIILLLFPVAVGLIFQAVPDWAAVGKGLIATAPMYWAVGIVEVITFIPMLGAGGSYLSFVTGNISNLKLPCALSAMEKNGVKAGTEEGDIISTISIAVSSAVALSKSGLDVPFFFNRKEAKDHGEGGVFVGYVPKSGENIVIVEDVITAGTAIRESMEILSSIEGAKVIATFVMVDRKEKGKTEKSAMAEVGEEFGFPVYSVVDVYDIIEYLEEDESNRENVERIKKYLEVNGAKA